MPAFFLSFPNCHLRTINVTSDEMKSDTDPASHTPGSPINRGKIRRAGIKNRT